MLALWVNPFDIQELADSIDAALTIEAGGARAPLSRTAPGYRDPARDPADWVDEQLEDIRIAQAAQTAAERS